MARDDIDGLLFGLIREGVSISINPQANRRDVEVRLLRGGVVAQSAPAALHEALLDASGKFDERVESLAVAAGGSRRKRRKVSNAKDAKQPKQ